MSNLGTHSGLYSSEDSALRGSYNLACRRRLILTAAYQNQPFSLPQIRAHRLNLDNSGSLSVYTGYTETSPIAWYEMTENSHISDKALQPVNCVCYRLRRAARLAAKTYDGALKPTGLRNTQFALLGSLNQLGEPSIGELSERLATDGTTLTRNLEVLVRRGLVEDVAADDARVRVIRLTKLGKKTYDAALPLWCEAQKHVLGAVGSKRWTEMRVELDKVEAACTHPA